MDFKEDMDSEFNSVLWKNKIGHEYLAQIFSNCSWNLYQYMWHEHDQDEQS
jgi:hypothetical protein